MKRIQIIAAGVVALLTAACATLPAPAPQITPVVSGTFATLAVVVKSETGAPLPGAECVVHTGERGIAGADGYYKWMLAVGERHVECTLDGYEAGAVDFAPFLANMQQDVVLRAIPPPAPPFVSATRPLVGPLRVQDKRFVDDSGYRRVLFASWFTALKTLRDDPREFARQLDAIAAAGYQGARVFAAVGGWSDFWDRHEVLPLTFRKWYYDGNFLRTAIEGNVVSAWPDYDDTFRALLREFKKRNLYVDLTVGDMQIIVANDREKELGLARRLSQIAAEEGGTAVIALVEGTNEFPINRYGGGSDESIEQLGRVLDVWRRAIPGVLTTEGAVISEEPERLLAGVRYGQVAAVHVSRDPIEMFVKRTFGLTNWEGNWRFFPVPFWHTEPLGPGKDSFAAQNDPANLTAAYAMPALLGHATNYFNGPAVRGDGRLESTWGFLELPRILAVLPEDISTWDHASDGRGGIMYFFRGKQFATSTVAAWNTAPPFPVAEWTLYAGDQVTHGNGAPPARVTGLLVGRFQ